MLHLNQCKVCHSFNIFTIKKYRAFPELNASWGRVFESVLKHTKPFSIRLAMCMHCGFIFYRDIFDLDELTALYSNEHRYHSSRKKNIERGGNEEVNRILRFFHKYIDFSKFESIIDIGAGDFTLMDSVMTLAPKAELAAIDPCFELDVYRDRVHIAHAMIEKLQVNKTYDLSLAVHILEHVADLDIFMEKLSQLTKEYTYIEVPFQVGPGLLLNRAVNTQHINYFSPASLLSLLKRYGFSVEQLEFDTEGYTYNGMPGMIRVLAKKTSTVRSSVGSGVRENLFYLLSPWLYFKHFILKKAFR